jgi:hypothetical protein
MGKFRTALAATAAIVFATLVSLGGDFPGWDLRALGRLDETNKACTIADGLVTVDLASDKDLCPTGLGHLASGMATVNRIVLRFEAPSESELWFHAKWHPGGSGEEQFEVFANGGSIGKSELIDAAAAPYEVRTTSFALKGRKGANELLLVRGSGDGLHFENLLLTSTPGVPEPAETPSEAAPTPASLSPPPSREPPLPTGLDMKPTLEYPTAEAYSEAIGEPGVVVESKHVLFFAPKSREREARIIAPYLEKAYTVLYQVVGVHTKYRIVVYHFPDGSPMAEGGTSECVIRYSFSNLALETQPEWTSHRVPHVAGYIEEMAHNFVDSARAQFGWEAMGWTLGVKTADVVAGNPIHTAKVSEVLAADAATYRQYRSIGYALPKNLPSNQCDRIHIHLLWECERRYGGDFWVDFFKEVRKERPELLAAVNLGGSDVVRNERYRLTVDCFNRLEGLDFKKLLEDDRISTTVAIKTLARKDGWNRHYR